MTGTSVSRQTGTALVVSLAWRDGLAYLEYAPAFLTEGHSLSPLHHPLDESGLVKPHDLGCFEGLHGMFHDSLPDGWGRLLVDRQARRSGINPASLMPLDRLACVGKQGMGALIYTPASPVWGDVKETLDIDRLAAHSARVLEGDAIDVLDELGRVGSKKHYRV